MNTVNLTEPLSLTSFGELVGISPAAASDLQRGGILRRGAPVADWLIAYTSHLRAHAAGRAGELDAAQERAALTRVRRETAEAHLAELRKDLVRIEKVKREFGTRLVAVREALRNLGDRIAPLAAAETDPSAVARLLRDEHRQALTAFCDALPAPSNPEESK